MRLYTASSEDSLRARKLLTEWAREGLLTAAQYQRLEQATVSELRTTNIFLRLTLFLFTLISVAAAAALFFVVFLSRPSEQTTGIFFLIFAVICYTAAEAAVAKFHLYRYGIEEALAASSLVFLCAGMQAVLFSGSLYSIRPGVAYFLVPAAGALSSLWIWRRLGLWYAFVAAMIFALLLPGHWSASHSVQHGIVAALYASGLICITAVRSRRHFDYLEDPYSLVEAFLWLGVYLAINIKLSSLDLPAQLWGGGSRIGSEFGKPFYWTTWVLTWCLPPLVLARGIQQKNRFVIAVGAIVAILTLVTNKPYFGWQQHSWDPMLLGILLSGTALFIRGWLMRGLGGIRHGFTAAHLSGKDKRLMNAGHAVLGLVTPQLITPAPQPDSTDFHFGGGASGGGGAGGDF